jgi:tRNA G18 (ribose-2'-O)-methylase SpoU
MKRPLVIVHDRLRSAHNVGNIFRLAEALNAEIIGCGSTPMPPHPKLERTAMGTDKSVPFRSVPEVVDAIRLLRQEQCGEILAAEPGGGRASEAWQRIYKLPLAIIFGNEALGVHPEALKLVDGLVSLPMLGSKCSINVSNAAAAILYAVEARTLSKDNDNEN